jgi:hypothetical protein
MLQLYQDAEKGVFGLKYVFKHIGKWTMEAVGTITWIKLAEIFLLFYTNSTELCYISNM